MPRLPVLTPGAAAVSVFAATMLAWYQRQQPAPEVLRAEFITMLVLAIVLAAASYFLAPKPKTEDARPADLGDFKFPTATEGRPVPLVWGRVQLTGPNVVWYGDYRAKEIKDDNDNIIGHKYSLGMQLALCRGVVDDMRRIWIGDKLYYDGVTPSTPPAGNGGVLEFGDTEFHQFYDGDSVGGNGGVAGRLRFYDGRNDQIRDTYLAGTGRQGANCPGYVGTSHIVWEGPSQGDLESVLSVPGGIGIQYASAPVGYLGNSPQIDAWKIEVDRHPNQLGIPSGQHIVNSADANPAAVLYEILTDNDWGMGLAPAVIDTVNFLAVASTLFTEGNGFSFVLDKIISGDELIEEIERQIDGHLFVDRVTGKYKVSLVRGDYVVANLDPIDDVDVDRVDNYNQQDWSDTENIMRVKYTTRDDATDDYKETYALAQDMGNIRVQGFLNVPATKNFPGIKDSTSASEVATRELRQATSPKISGTLITNRRFYYVNPGDVLRWTNVKRNIVDLPIRITGLELGNIEDGEVSLHFVEDVFSLEVAMFAGSPDSGWVFPTTVIQAVPTDEDIVEMISRMHALRDDVSPGVIDRIFVGSRYQFDNTSRMNVWSRNAAGAPSGSYSFEGTYSGFQHLRIGQLNATLDQDTANPTATPSEDIRVDDIPDELRAMLIDGAQDSDLGQNLVNLIRIEDEYLFFNNVTIGSGFITIKVVYRAVGDSVTREHASGTDVFLYLGIPGSIIIPGGNQVDVQLRGVFGTTELAEGSANTVNFTMNDRARRPYPVTDLEIEGTRYAAGPIDLDSTTASGSGNDTVGFDAGFTRRDFATFDERLNVLGTVGSGFPTDNTTEHRMVVTNDPAGSPVVIFTGAWTNAATFDVSRTDLIAGIGGTGADVPARLRVEIETRHTFETVVYEATQVEQWDFDTDSTLLDPLDPTGAMDDGVDSGTFIATADTGDVYRVTLSTSVLTGGGVFQVDLDGGGFVTILTSGQTTNTLTITSGQVVKWKHSQATGGVNTLLVFRRDTDGVDEAFGVVKT